MDIVWKERYDVEKEKDMVLKGRLTWCGKDTDIIWKGTGAC